MDLTLMPDERLLIETEPKGLALTTHRVRSEAREQGRVIIKSIMLEEIASSAITSTANPILLALAALAAAAGIGFGTQMPDGHFVIAGGIVVGALFVIGYFASREQVIQIESAGATIRKSIRSNNLRRAREFLEAAERAKNERYLLGVAAMVGRAIGPAA